MALAAPFAPFALQWDAPQLTPAELHDVWSSFEWWYFDLATDDGVELVVVFSRKNPIFATDKVSVYVEYTAPGTAFKHIRNYEPSAFSYTEGAQGRELRVGPNTVRIVGDSPQQMHYEVSIDLPWISGTLQMTPEHLGFLPSANGRYFQSKNDAASYTAVSFSAPIMQTSGTLTVDGKTEQVSGRGYHDHPWGTQQLFWTHHEWHWGRTTTPQLGVMFATVTPQDAYEGTLCFLWSGATGEFQSNITGALTVTPSQWKKDSLVGINFPHQLGVQVPGSAWSAGFQRSLLDTPMYERSAVTWLPAGGGATGSGWTEYFKLKAPFIWIAFLGARVTAFFWRSFPWFGR